MESIAINPTFSIGIPAPSCIEISYESFAVTFVFAVADLFSKMIRRGSQFAAITTDIEVFQVDKT
jgi:hypothetical protein